MLITLRERNRDAGIPDARPLTRVLDVRRPQPRMKDDDGWPRRLLSLVG